MVTMDDAIGQSLMKIIKEYSSSDIFTVSAEFNFVNQTWLITSLFKGFLTIKCQVWEFEGKLCCELLAN